MRKGANHRLGREVGKEEEQKDEISGKGKGKWEMKPRKRQLLNKNMLFQ
jgi:hypothetical protein